MRTLRDVTPTAEQLPILADSMPGFRLIRGAAGSGKTTAAILRLQQLCASGLSRLARLGSTEPLRVLALTFNRTLRGYVAELIPSPTHNMDLKIETFGSWARAMIEHGKIMDYEASRKFISGRLARIGITDDIDYFTDEIHYIMGRFSPDAREAYLHALRTGRGRAPAVPETLRQRLLTDSIHGILGGLMKSVPVRHAPEVFQ